MEAELKQGIQEFNSSMYFECHDRLFSQGVIQVFICFFHLLNGSVKGTRSTLGKGIPKLASYPAAYQGVKSGEFLRGVKRLLEKLERLPKGNCSFSEPESIPKIHCDAPDESSRDPRVRQSAAPKVHVVPAYGVGREHGPLRCFCAAASRPTLYPA